MVGQINFFFTYFIAYKDNENENENDLEITRYSHCNIIHTAKTENF